MILFLPIFLATVLTTSAWADSICREPEVADFGLVVSSQTSNSFVITRGCAEDRLEVKKPVHLSALIVQRTETSISVTPSSPRSTWTVFFDLALADLDDSDRLVISQVPSVSRVRITGYTCSIGSEDYNDELSRRRAEVVASYLRSRGVTIISIEGKGECCPLSATDLSRNRRVVIEEE